MKTERWSRSKCLRNVLRRKRTQIVAGRERPAPEQGHHPCLSAVDSGRGMVALVSAGEAHFQMIAGADACETTPAGGICKRLSAPCGSVTGSLRQPCHADSRFIPSQPRAEGKPRSARQAFVLPSIAPFLSHHESEKVTKWRLLRGLGGSASMDEVLLDIMLVLGASVLLAMLWRQFKRQVNLRRADRIARTIGDVGVTGGDRRLKQLLAAYRLARAKSHLDAGAFLYPAAEALVSEFRLRQLERRKETETWRSLTLH